LSEEEEADAVNDTLSPNSWEKQAEAEEVCQLIINIVIIV
jgi:hypothetical protein